MIKQKIIFSKEEFLRQCAQSGVELPYSDGIGILREPFKISGKLAPNRIAYQPMEGADGALDGSPDELTARRYKRFARGGAGIIWIEACAAEYEGRANPRQLFISGENLDGFKRLAEIIRQTSLAANGYSPIIILQLTHSGRYSRGADGPMPLVAYRNPVLEKGKEKLFYKVLSDGELERTGERLAAGAKLAQEAGFDGADIKCSHGYLLAELLSAYARQGKYGGTFENRTGLLTDTVRAAVSLTKNGFIVASRLNIYDGFEYPYGFGVREGCGLLPDYSDAVTLTQKLRGAGLSLLNITMGNPYVNPHVNRPFASGDYDSGEHPLAGVARMLHGTAVVRKAVPDLPVVASALSYLGAAAGQVAAGCIADGMFDFAGWGRAAFANPDTANEILFDKKLEIGNLCLTCGGCTKMMRAGLPAGCPVRDKTYADIMKGGKGG